MKKSNFQKNKINFWVILKLVFSLSLTDWYFIIKKDIYHFLNQGSIPLAIEIYNKIHECPLYTRNIYMEIRTMLVIRLFNENLFSKSKENFDFINMAFLLTLIDCIADTLADELQTNFVLSILVGMPDEDKAKIASKFLVRMKKQTKLSLRGEGSGKEFIHDQGTSAILEHFSLFMRELYSKYETLSSFFDLISPVMDWSVDYMFSSHEYSVKLHNTYSTFEKKVKLLPVLEHLKNIAGGTNYALVFFSLLLGKREDCHAEKLLVNFESVEKLKDISESFSMIHALGNGLKSYKRESLEKDFSSWVWNYLSRTSDWDEIRPAIHNFLENKGDPDEFLSKIDIADLNTYFYTVYSALYENIMEKAEGLLPSRYIMLLDIILYIEMRSGRKEEREQLLAFQKREH